MDVTVDSGNDDAAFAVAGLLFQVLLQVADRALHDLSALQHERQDQLARAEAVADVFHCRQENVVQHGDCCVGARPRGSLRNGFVQQRFDAFLFAMQNPVVDALVNRQVGVAVTCDILLGLHVHPLKCREKPGQGIFAAVIDQVFGQRPMLGVDLGIRCQMDRIDDGQVEADLNTVVQERRVEHAARGMRDAE